MKTKLLAAVLCVFVGVSLVWALSRRAPEKVLEPIVLARFGRSEKLHGDLDRYIQSQWKNHGAVWLPEKCGDINLIIFYVHGFMPFRATDKTSYYFFSPLKACLSDVCYSLCTPGLDGSRKFLSFAQGFDTYQVEEHLQRLLQKRAEICPNTPVLCIGHSNGAATLTALLCSNHSLARQVNGVILLGGYADVTHASLMATWPEWLGGKITARKIMRLLLAPNHDGMVVSPVACVEKGYYPQGLPTLLVHSRKDGIVPYTNFEMLKVAFEAHNPLVQFLTVGKERHLFRHLSPEFKETMRGFIQGVVEKARA